MQLFRKISMLAAAAGIALALAPGAYGERR